MSGERLVFADGRRLQEGAAALVALAIRRCVAARGTCRLCLAGGTTPRELYRLLADEAVVGRVPFDRVELLFGDERCVPPDHPDSNFAMAQAAFGDAFSSFAAVHRMEGEREDAEAAARSAAQAFATPVDVLLLGMGPDGHVASLFPHSAALDRRDVPVVAVVGPKPPPRRLTITPAVIAAAAQVVVLVGGAEKAPAVRRALTPGDVREIPARLVRDARWMMDAAAASQWLQMHEQEQES